MWKNSPGSSRGRRKWLGTAVQGFLGKNKAESYVELKETLVKNSAQQAARCLAKSISLKVIFINERRTWEHTQRSKASALYRHLNAVIKNNIRGVYFSSCFIVIVNLKNDSLLNIFLWSYSQYQWSQKQSLRV